MRIAIVGCGQISYPHVGAIQDIPGLEVCAVCDRNKYNAEDLAQRAKGAKVYTDFTALLAEAKPDVVHVLTPPDTHASLGIEAMEAGCHVLIEKPMTLNLEEADALIAAAKANGVTLCTNHNALYKPSIAKALKLVESGAIGEVVHVDGFYGVAGASYQVTEGKSHWAWGLPGGAFTNFVPHMTYLLLAFMPEVKSVAGVTLAQAQTEGVPTTEMAILLQGTSASGVMTFAMRAKPYAKFVDIYGTNGLIHADLVREVCTVNKARPLPAMISKVLFSMEDSLQTATGTTTNTAKFALGKIKSMAGLRALVQDFYAKLQAGQAPPVSGEDGRRMVEIMEMVWDKARADGLTFDAPKPPKPITEPQTVVEHQLVDDESLIGKTVFVTGATGFLGSNLVGALARCGAKVRALVRDLSTVSPTLEKQAALIKGDVRDTEVIKEAVKGVDIVYHCAAITRNRVRWDVHYDVNVRATEELFKASLAAGVKHVVNVSSVAIYGVKYPIQSGTVHESAPYATDEDKWGYYMLSKRDADKLALRYAQEENLPVSVVRLGILYGPGRRAPGRGLVRMGPARFLIGTGKNNMPYTYITNAVDGVLLASVVPGAGGEAYNIVDEPQVSARSVTKQNIKMTGAREIVVPIPPMLLGAVASFFERRSNKANANTPPPLTHFVVDSAVRDIYYDTSKAREQLGWEPEVSIEEGLRKTLDSQD